MPGNENYNKLLGFICPGYNSEQIDFDWRTVGILGMPRAGKTVLSFTIANDLEAKFKDEFIMVYGYWLHKVMDYAVENKLFEGKRIAYILIDDATSRVNVRESRQNLLKDMRAYFEIAHLAEKAGLKKYTGWIILTINFHTYMAIEKYFRNAHVLIVKSLIPKWQRFEHEDITLRWLDWEIMRQLTYMRYSADKKLSEKALSKALAIVMTGWSEIITYDAVKEPPKNFVNLRYEERGEEGSNPPLVPITQDEFIKDARIKFKIHADDKKLRAFYRYLFRDVLGYKIIERPRGLRE